MPLLIFFAFFGLLIYTGSYIILALITLTLIIETNIKLKIRRPFIEDEEAMDYEHKIIKMHNNLRVIQNVEWILFIIGIFKIIYFFIVK